MVVLLYIVISIIRNEIKTGTCRSSFNPTMRSFGFVPIVICDRIIFHLFNFSFCYLTIQLKDVPLNEYALRKAIRLQIRQLKVKQGKSLELCGCDYTWLFVFMPFPFTSNIL